MEKWVVRIKVLCISGIFVTIANFITTWKGGAPVPPLEAVPAMLGMFAIVVAGCLIQELFEHLLHIKLPGILFISGLTVLLSIPGFSPVAEWMAVEFNKVSLLALCTPILAYAGISIGKDLEDFKKQGFAIMCVACLTFVGTYVGSAFVAQLVLQATHVI